MDKSAASNHECESFRSDTPTTKTEFDAYGDMVDPLPVLVLLSCDMDHGVGIQPLLHPTFLSNHRTIRWM